MLSCSPEVLFFTGAHCCAPSPCGRGHRGRQPQAHLGEGLPPRKDISPLIEPLIRLRFAKTPSPTRGDGTLNRRKERQRRAVGGLEHHFHLLADLQLVHVAIDEIGQQRRALLQRDVADRVRPRGGLAHQAEAVDLALARAFLPHRLVGEAERADRARKIMRFAAGGAALDQELALYRLLPEMPGFGIALRRRVFDFRVHHTRSRMQVDAAWRTPRRPPVPWATARSQFLTCTLGCACPRSCRTASMILVMPPRLTG